MENANPCSISNFVLCTLGLWHFFSFQLCITSSNRLFISPRDKLLYYLQQKSLVIIKVSQMTMYIRCVLGNRPRHCCPVCKFVGGLLSVTLVHSQISSDDIGLILLFEHLVLDHSPLVSVDVKMRGLIQRHKAHCSICHI